MSGHELIEDESVEREVPEHGMRVETWIFLALTIFFVLAAVLYGVLVGSSEPVGVVALALTAGLTLMVGTFLNFSSRRLDQARPEDDDDADVADGAGELGFFSPGSYWPLAIACAAASTAIAVAFWQIWLLIICVGFLVMSICGLTYEYHRRARTH